MMKHVSNEKKHVPYLNGNPTRTVAISKAVALLDISVGVGVKTGGSRVGGPELCV